MEDYKKKYEQALTRAKDYDPDLTGLSVGEILEDIFPELKESEDDRVTKAIRKVIIQCLDSEKVLDNCGITYEDIDAWLEKQKHINDTDEQEPCEKAKHTEYSTMLQSIWGKVCELEGKLGDIYKAISKPYQDIKQPVSIPSNPMQCWFPDGICMNPHRDCVNCPRPNVGRYTTSTSSTNLTKAIRTMEGEE